MFTIVIEFVKDPYVRISVYLRGFLLRLYIVRIAALIDYTLTDTGFTCRMARRSEAQPIEFFKRELQDGRHIFVSKKLGARQMAATCLHVHPPTRKLEQPTIAELIPDFLR